MSNLQAAIDGNDIDRIEIELLENCSFRWKLWSDGSLIYCAIGRGVSSEIEAMIKTTNLITKTMLGVQPNEEEFSTTGAANERQSKVVHRPDRDDNSFHSAIKANDR